MSSISVIDWVITMVLIGVAWRFLASVEHSDQNATIEQSGLPLRTAPALLPANTKPLDDQLDRVLGMADGVDRDQFLSGAKLAYEHIVSAFAAGDLVSVRNLLSEPVRTTFLAAITQRQERSETLSTLLVGFSSAEPVAAGLDRSNAWISVRFVVQLVSFLTDREGRITQGHPTNVVEITEIWTFERSILSKDPNWILVTTDGGA
ncbi:MAG TPA: Tim44/TimA family putative adaptor protein [Pelagibacterium sp.]|uniref:Tim44/TimA family putative adaptor protein n=1 Tax=Pelagibacterium sp. TaxID=1967288 RepID=UPI002CBCB3F6|nr:Tim44/TimA family putative adaptor protein [Pelagibacterium sp.]HWJ86825.1 Tim44/TimA family putative adaptor protein [Pelagibacterium sp.]